MNVPRFIEVLPEHLIHATCTYYGNWLPGDPRGFRSEDHCIHSSGDYRNKPPAGDHGRLHDQAGRIMKHSPVVLEGDERQAVGEAFLDKMMRKLNRRVLVITAAAKHLHILYVGDGGDATVDLGRAKQYASHQLTSRPGTVWARGEGIKRVATLDHANRALPYIAEHELREGAWVWIAPQFEERVRAYLKEKWSVAIRK